MTPEKAKSLSDVNEHLERARATKRRVRIFYGDCKTGRDFLEWQETVGYVVRPDGKQGFYLKRRTDSDPGGEILVDQIVRLMVKAPGKNGPFEEVYRHPSYYIPSLQITSSRQAVFYNNTVSVTENPYAVCIENLLALGAFTTKAKAGLFIKFLNGERAVR